MQSKKQSLIETLSNTFLGMLGSFGITMGVLALFTQHWVIGVVTTVLCTVWSIARGYYVRRYFNKKHAQQGVVVNG